MPPQRPNSPAHDHPYLAAARERVVIFDGAGGTYLQGMELDADDFGGADYEGCNEYLALSKPEAVAELHDAYLAAGCDVVETNTFGSFSVPLAEYDLGHKAHEISRESARIAKEVAAGYATPDRPRWVAGAMGPGTKMPSLGHIPFADLRDAYQVQAHGLLEGGVDLFLIETQYDPLGAKAAIIACRRAMAEVGRVVPIQVQVTIELTGRMLPGTEIGAALTTLGALRPDVFGLNCATGPEEMHEHLRHLSQHSPMPISCLPNAGLPSVVEGKMHYDLSPEQLAEHHAGFVTGLGVSVVGGCCGTNPDHIRALVERCRDLEPARREPTIEPGTASLYTHVPFEQDASVLMIGERTNANGSRKFRESMLEGDWDTVVQMAREQVAEGAHLLDLCVDYTGADGVADMTEAASRLATQATAPIVLDSTEPEVIEAGLHWMGGRPVLNSVNLEDGDAEGTRLDRFLKLAAEYGAGVVVTCIDETGQARDADWKVDVARRVTEIAVERYGLDPSDLLIDPLALTLSTGMDESRRDGLETIEGIRRIKAEVPGVHTTLGLSNISFGFKPALRHVLNSVYLHECQEAGLDSAIVHAGKILPLNRIEDEHRELCLDLIYDRRRDDYDPLSALLDAFADVQSVKAQKEDRSDWPVTDRLKQRIIDGDRDGLVDDLEQALGEGVAPLEIINDHLLSGMKVVGDLFGAGEMQLPFVLQSAETMKTAVAHLEQYMDKSDSGGRGKIVLATVKGDVHDIGKNLVDIILTNNGYDVRNLGIKVPLGDMVSAAQEMEADAIGMSGLLVKSTIIMRENLEEMNRLGMADVPVLLGGAALTRSYVERDMRDVYEGRVFYGRDAFEGLHTMDRIAAVKRGEVEDDPDWGRVPSESRVPTRVKERYATEKEEVEVPERSPEVVTDNPVPTPPFVGSRVVKGVPLDDIAAYLNETALFRNQWQFRPEKGEDDAAFKDRIRPLLRQQLDRARAEDLLVPQVVYGYFPANGDGNDVVIWKDEERASEWMRFPFPRQREHPFLCIADFFRPVDSGEVDYAAFHIVTMGSRVSERARELFERNEYREYLFVHGLGVEMAEALAELWHRRIREEWGFADEDGPTLQGLFRQQYRGGRYSWGYPACPDLEDNEKVADLLDADRIGIEVSEETGYQYQPEQTTSAIVCHHPRAKYFVAR